MTNRWGGMVDGASVLGAASHPADGADLQPADSGFEQIAAPKGFLDNAHQPPGNHSFTVRVQAGRHGTLEQAIWKQLVGSVLVGPACSPRAELY